MSSEESSSKQGEDQDVNQASSQPKSIASDVIIEPIGESVKQDNDVIKAVPSETRLTNQVVQPMSRGNDNEAVVAENTFGGKFLKKLTRDDSMDISDSKCWWCCLGLCGCCTACCACLLFIPCLALTVVFNCLMCPVNTAVGCCCPSTAQPITIQIDDLKSFQSMFN